MNTQYASINNLGTRTYIEIGFGVGIVNEIGIEIGGRLGLRVGLRLGLALGMGLGWGVPGRG